jgi:hypothetical protein
MPVEFLTDEQLGIEDISCAKQYAERKPTAYEHAWEIPGAATLEWSCRADGRGDGAERR